MTEAEWAACRDPRQMLDYHRMKRSPRRLRLLAVACARNAFPTEAGPLFAEVLAVAERYADGTAPRAEFLAARKAIRQAARDGRHSPALLRALRGLTDDAMEGLTVTIEVIRPRARSGGAAAECGLIRCLFGNLYYPTRFDPAWLTPVVLSFAQAIYEGSAFDQLPALADALQAAGCADETILGHARGPDPHARGCWVVDGLLGRP